MVTLHASLDSCIYSKVIELHYSGLFLATNSTCVQCGGTLSPTLHWPVDFLLRLVKIFGH